MKRQRVTDALIAATLSRNLEKPRTEIDDRFYRAIRYADSNGSERQKLETRYEHIWTAFWWFDDFEFLKNSYDDFEKMALQSEYSYDLEFLCNLVQLLFNGVIHHSFDPEEYKLRDRVAKLQKKLENIAADKDRPNNAATAQFALLIIRINQAVIKHSPESLSTIWHEFSDLLKKIEGLGEFRADRLEKIIAVFGQIAGNDPAYNTLIEEVAEFFEKREGEVKAASILLKRAEQLDFDNNVAIIRFLGKVAIKLLKKECSELLIRAMSLLTFAYKSAGMLWAARASCCVLASSLIIEAEKESQLPQRFVPTMKIWAWIALELGNLPDFLFAIQMLNGSISSLPLTDESKGKIQEDITQLDDTLVCLFLNLDDNELKKLSNLPDVLDALGLDRARCALLYTLGHEDIMRADGSIPEKKTEEMINNFFSSLYSQPADENLPQNINLNQGGLQTLKTILLGMQVELSCDDQPSSIVKAQSILAALEAFFSTTLEQRIFPHREKLSIILEESDGSESTFDIDTTTMQANVKWSKSLRMKIFDHQSKIYEFLTEISVKVLATAFSISDSETLLKALYAEEEVHHRMMMAIFASNSYSRVTTKEALQLSDWQDFIQQSYVLKPERPQLQKIDLSSEEDPEDKKPVQNGFTPPKITDHRSVKIYSVIDIHAWNQVEWSGMTYVHIPHQPPCMVLIFENKEGARKIFEGWQSRFGKIDKEDKISISIIRDLPDKNRHHYCVQVSSKLPEIKKMNPIKKVFIQIVVRR